MIDAAQIQPKKYDIIIVGGGMVGSALACALSNTCALSDNRGSNNKEGNSTLKLALIEGCKPLAQWPEDSFDLRVSAISRVSKNFFETLGVWDAMYEMRATAYTEMYVWDAGGNGSIHFDSAEIGEASLGHIIENRIINKALIDRVHTFNNIDIYCPNNPINLQLDSGLAKLQLDDGTLLEAELLVGADGGQSWVRQQADIAVTINDYQQTAVVANITTEHSHRHTAWQRFLPDGPLAFLPVNEDNISSIVWSTSAEEAERLCELDETTFKQELEIAFEAKLGKILHTGPRARFPIKGQHAKNYVKPHLALIGDAAHTIHPLAGQGVNLGFADAQCLANIVLMAHTRQKNIGSFKILRRFERARRGDNLLMLEAMGAFKQLFSNNTPGLRELRNIGLDFSDRVTPIKHFFMTKALGQ
ncbi:MAG: UbiH/UbiF/VisC/COQ6 family ubiquinone biosynthesis hydroxylase [Gammaproteobacteria bacterium]|nr:UbiH/UbiF/VisC/COQ6 family ubiquinone biosynthesis hydroxylase [Gammaproteobacteria bacterium]